MKLVERKSGGISGIQTIFGSFAATKQALNMLNLPRVKIRNSSLQSGTSFVGLTWIFSIDIDISWNRYFMGNYQRQTFSSSNCLFISPANNNTI